MRRKRTGIDDSAGAGGGIKSEGRGRDIDDSPADSDGNQIDIIQGRPARVPEERRVLDSNGLGHRAKTQRPRKVDRFEARKTIRECGLVQALALGQKR